MILCLKGNELGKVRDLYFLSIRAKNGINNHKIFEIASGDTNLLFSPIRKNMEAVSSKYVSGIKEAGMGTVGAIADANSENWSQSRETKKQIEDLKEEIKEIYAQVRAGQQENTKIMTALIDRLSGTTGEFNMAYQKIDRSHSAIRKLQLKTFWLKWAEWFSPLLALTIVGGAGFFAGGWLTYQKYNSYVDELGRDIMGWNLDRLVKCRDDKNPKCTFWIVPPEQRE